MDQPLSVLVPIKEESSVGIDSPFAWSLAAFITCIIAPMTRRYRRCVGLTPSAGTQGKLKMTSRIPAALPPLPVPGAATADEAC